MEESKDSRFDSRHQKEFKSFSWHIRLEKKLPAAKSDRLVPEPSLRLSGGQGRQLDQVPQGLGQERQGELSPNGQTGERSISLTSFSLDLG